MSSHYSGMLYDTSKALMAPLPTHFGFMNAQSQLCAKDINVEIQSFLSSPSPVIANVMGGMMLREPHPK